MWLHGDQQHRRLVWTQHGGSSYGSNQHMRTACMGSQRHEHGDNGCAQQCERGNGLLLWQRHVWAQHGRQHVALAVIWHATVCKRKLNGQQHVAQQRMAALMSSNNVAAAVAVTCVTCERNNYGLALNE
ncbi:hypothetical protein KOW79_021604 [Hemibagrus wyckioides]|uniref:Uncharacterized protein n=1 Tax=Hemibagrus wyckioides TaxID=337641 RepID=A0A9D3S7P4_9TELE|nr:hypothetical protein KOW79_021604 [Hemibagrus wyckioides]